jgi:phosphoribosyl-dephospho-CoA transferase
MKQMAQRHHLVWLDPDLDLRPYALFPECAAFASDWIAQGQPFVVSRQPKQSVEDPPHIALGLTLPPPATRKRMSLFVPTETILRHSGPLELSQALPHAPLWQGIIQQLLVVCSTAAVVPCVYGSLLWQSLSSHKYVTDTSDLDVLFVCTEVSDVHLLMGSLADFEGSEPRVDGEILAPSGWAAAWREVATAFKTRSTAKVLAKSSDEVRLVSLDEFFGQRVT